MVTSLTEKTNIARALGVWPHACHEPCPDRSETSFRNNFRVDLQIMKLLKRRNVKLKDISHFRFKLSALKEMQPKLSICQLEVNYNGILLTNKLIAIINI